MSTDLARWAPLAFVVPMVAAAVLAAVGRYLPRRVRDAVALAAAGASAAISGALAWGARDDLLVGWVGGWAVRGDVAFGIALAIDPLGAGFAALSGVLACAALVFALRWFDEAGGHFDVLVLVFLAALCGFGLTADLFDLFVFFELMSVAGYALAGYRSEEPDVLEGALHFGIVNTVGACLVLVGLALAYGATGALSLAQLARAIPSVPPPLPAIAFALIACGFLVKAAAVPFHFWLADAHAVAPTPACVLFSGVMVVAGLYAVARLEATAFHAVVPAGGVGPGAALVVLGGLTAAVGAALAFAQRHLKRLLAFSTIAHVGVMLVGIGLATPAGIAAAAVYALGHGLVKGALFLGAGLVLHGLRSVDEVALRGRGRHLPWTGALLGLGGLALAGAPPFATFRGEALLHRALEEAGWGAIAPLLTVAAVVTGAAVLRATLRIFAGLGPRAPDAPEVGGEVTERAETTRSRARSPATMVAAAAALLALGAVAGAWPGLAAGAHAAGARFVDADGYAARVMQGRPMARVPPAPGESLAGPGLRATLSAGAALALAVLVLRRRRLPAAVRAVAARLWNPPIAALRALHTGRIGESVAWLALGAAVLGGLFAWLG